MIAAAHNYKETFNALVKAGANVNQRNRQSMIDARYGNTVLMIAAYKGCIDVVQELIQCNVNVNDTKS